MKTQTAQPIRWLFIFFLFNIVISYALFLTYLRYAPAFAQQAHATPARMMITWTFTLFSYLTQAIILNTLWVMPILLLKKLRIPTLILVLLAIVFSTLFNMLIVSDTVTYGLYRAHELDTALTIFQANALGEVMPMSWKEMGAFIVAGLFMLLIELIFVGITFRYNQFIRNFPARKTLLSLLGISCLITYGTLTVASDMPMLYQHLPHTDHFLLKGAAQVPYYDKFYRLLIPINHPNEHHYGSFDHTARLATRDIENKLNYPLKKISFAPQKKWPNILFLYIDTWRYDAFNQAASPNLYEFAQNQMQFDHYNSAGNCTKTGIFSLFYGLPANYWNAMRDQHVGPVFIQAVKQHHYQVGLFASATLRFPQFDKTVFAEMNNKIHRTRGNTTLDRDRHITKDFLDFLKHRNKNQPFFSFVFYDSVHNYCDGGPNSHQQPFTPAIQTCSRFLLTNTSDPVPYHHRYLNSVHFVDHQISKILAQLKQDDLLKNTIVIISADHGEEFNDSHLGYWSHASAYEQYQLHVPMIMHWPGMPAKHVTHFTTSLDVIPTLMQRVFRVKNKTSDYSVGKDLFVKHNRPFFIAESYTDYAIVTSTQIIRIAPNADYTINDKNGYLIPGAILPLKIIRMANQQLSKYTS